MHTPRACSVLLATGLLGAACGGGGETGPKLGTPEYSWQAAAEFAELGQFGKAIDPLDNLAAGDSELKNRAILWRAVLQDGLARANQELAEGYRLAMDGDKSLAGKFQNPIQQAYRDARRYSIDFVESLGELEKAIDAGAPLDFPFPGGSAAKAPALAALERGQDVLDSQLSAILDATVRRGVILSATELAGKGEAESDARAAFEAGPIAINADETKLTVAKMLLDRSVVLDKLRLYQPDIRKIVVDRAEQWIKPYLESENEALKKRAEQLQKEVEDERRELDGRRRLLKLRG